MTPKEKAKELVDKFLLTENGYKEYADSIQAKQCALICVDEIENELRNWEGSPDEDERKWESRRYKYIQELKKEIKLS